MDKQQLMELFGSEYPKTKYYEKILLERLELFPNAINVYKNRPKNLYLRSNEWFLVEQLSPELALNPYADISASRHMRNIIYGKDIYDIDWSTVYRFVDTQLEDCLVKEILNGHREWLLPQYDTI